MDDDLYITKCGDEIEHRYPAGSIPISFKIKCVDSLPEQDEEQEEGLITFTEEQLVALKTMFPDMVVTRGTLSPIE